jgi:S-adenosylmethionine:tRNA ribosyltransferase-isomerase
LSDFDYELPVELIAQTPASTRTSSRLLHVDATGGLHDSQFAFLTQWLKPNDLLVFNDTRVIQARLFGQKATGGKVEVLIERITATNEALAHIKASKSPGPGSALRLADAVDVTVLGRADDLFILKFDAPVLDILEPPGAVAAPTAGLHFDEAMFEQLEQLGVQRTFVTLHVGAGTFQPVRDGDLAKHVMHAEWYTVPDSTTQAIARARALGGRVIAVGTTSVRALESAAKLDPALTQPQSGDTRLFIQPGFEYKIVDAMITNFHLPQSTLLMLVSAFIGLEPMKRAYQHAIQERYRFFSYGDAMFLERMTSN